VAAKRWTLALLIGFALTNSALADETVRIEVQSSWTGLGSPASNRLVITGANRAYKADGQKVHSPAVTELLASLEAPGVERPSLDSCGVTESWLADNYASALTDYTHRKTTGLSSEQVQLFRSHFVSSSTARAAFENLFKNFHTDDYPEISVVVSKGGRAFSVHSESQYPFMLPWSATTPSAGGYSCRISRAIAALVGKHFPNAGRLVLSAGFRWNLASEVMSSIRDKWDLLDTESKVGNVISPILERFTLVKSAVSILSSIDLNGGQSWNAKLRSSQLPPNLLIGVSMFYRNRELPGVDTFLSRFPQYSNLVLSVPWLQKYLLERPEVTVELRYVNGQSLSPKALESLIADLVKHGKPQLADKVSAETLRCAFLEIDSGAAGWSRAVVLPSKEVLLWHFQGTSVLGFSAEGLESWDYFGWRSTATLVTPDGEISR
jgi:hypothetical protein